MNLYPRSHWVREAIKLARKITSMLQGTMALEGQGLDRATLREMKRRTIRDILARPNLRLGPAEPHCAQLPSFSY